MLQLPLPSLRTAVLGASVVAALAVLPAGAPAAGPSGAPAGTAVPGVAAPEAATPTRTVAVAPAASVRPTATGSSAVRHALGKVGAPYRWGADGPRAFDCSGLVNWAYRQEGVALPRTSGALASAGRPVSRSALRPGDLVLFYTPVSHVGIYVGGGRVVHASTSGSPVKVSDMDAMPFHSARRV